MPKRGRNAKTVNLALQGGGAHGAFTWGVLDTLLADDRLSIEGISGTSAGAMNAVVMADGYQRAGADGAREALEAFWTEVSRQAAFSPLQRNPLEQLFGTSWNLDSSPGFVAFDLLSRVASPYDLNPANINPLRDLLRENIDFDRVRCCSDFNLYITATNVHTGRAKVFRKHELGVEQVLASTCLPQMFQAVEIDGVPYWDGGFMGNPALWPFFSECQSNDILIVQINPIERKETPKTAHDINNRMNEITFNSSLQRELRAIDFVGRLIEDGRLTDNRKYEKILIHRIYDEDAFAELNASSKLNAEYDFLRHLFEIGKHKAETWLDAHYDDIGQTSTVDIRAMFE
ncbi:MAG: patatin-like phospholipase family protein [Alphaproteobacteria bacterium]|nr:patatin-like phospholipase family protein [Alphaproteobacteria bacterium SS10]